MSSSDRTAPIALTGATSGPPAVAPLAAELLERVVPEYPVLAEVGEREQLLAAG